MPVDGEGTRKGYGDGIRLAEDGGREYREKQLESGSISGISQKPRAMEILKNV